MTRGRRVPHPTLSEIDVDVPANSPSARTKCLRELPDGTECQSVITIGTDGDGHLVEDERFGAGWRRHVCVRAPEPEPESRPAPPRHRRNGAALLVHGVRFSAWLRSHRIARDWTQADLASRVGCTDARIGQMETECIGAVKWRTPLVDRLIALLTEG